MDPVILHLIQRQVARANGLRRYYTGAPCCAGHLVERDVRSKACLQCKRARDSERRADPLVKARRAEYDRQRWLNDHERVVAKNRIYYAQKKDSVNAQKRGYYEANRERMREANLEWRAANRHVVTALNVLRKKAIRQATPAWADREAIKLIYLKARRLTSETGVFHHVDHFYPLAGELVCGLHVHQNLRAIPWCDNLAKKNKHPS